MTRLAQAIGGQPWAIWPDALRRLAATPVLDADIAARLEKVEAAIRNSRQPQGETRVIPIHGVITYRPTLLGLLFGIGTTVRQIQAQFRQALADPSVPGIVLDFDSPGGSVDGITELAAEIRAARGQKPIVAVADTLMASASFWLGSQADEIVASPSALVGSVGVVAVHEDYSAANEQHGVAVTYVTAGKYKAEGNPDAPLDDEAQAHLQSLVDAMYAAFVSDVAKGRGVSPVAVRESYGQGRVVTAQAALKAGMVDRIDTLEGAMVRVARGKVALRAAEGVSYDITGTFAANTAYTINIPDGTYTFAPAAESVLEPLPPDPEPIPDPVPNPAYRVALAKARARQRTKLPT